MGILNLKDNTARKFIKIREKESASEHKISVKHINKVGVIAELSLLQTYDFTKRLCEGLKIEVEEMKVILYDPTGKAEAMENYRLCTEKDFGLNGKIKSEALNRFAGRKFDLLINYCDPELIFPKVIMLRSIAGLKAGFEHELNFFNDISIHIKENQIDTFNDELVKYLQILKLID